MSTVQKFSLPCSWLFLKWCENRAVLLTYVLWAVWGMPYSLWLQTIVINFKLFYLFMRRLLNMLNWRTKCLDLHTCLKCIYSLSYILQPLQVILQVHMEGSMVLLFLSIPTIFILILAMIVGAVLYIWCIWYANKNKKNETSSKCLAVIGSQN